MRVLIAGCGYVGCALGARLVEAGHAVFGLRRQVAALPSGVTPVRADLLDRPALARALPPALDAIVYAVAAAEHTADAYRAAYVEGLDGLLAALGDAEGRRLARLVYVSSTGVYAEDAGEAVDEETPARARGETERALLDGEARAAASDAPAVILRLGGIYGPGRDRLIRAARAAYGGDAGARAGAAGPEAPPAWTNRIHRDDAAGALAHLLALPEPARLYLGVDEEPALRADVLSFLAARLGLADPDEGRAAGARAAHGAARARGEERAPAGKRCSSARLRASGYRFRYPTFREGYAAVLEAMPRATAAPPCGREARGAPT